MTRMGRPGPDLVGFALAGVIVEQRHHEKNKLRKRRAKGAKRS